MEERLQRAKNALWLACRQLCPGYQVDEENLTALLALSHWLVDAPHELVEQGKGVFLRGPVGTGKSDLMRALSRAIVMGGGHGFQVVNAIRLVKEYNSGRDEHGNETGGDAVVLKYAHRSGLCIDDVGAEDEGKHYGKVTNVVSDLVALRYERWRHDPLQFVTHFTTNATNDQLRKLYDERTVSRIGEMARVVPLGGRDRRKEAKVEVSKGLFQDQEAEPKMSPEEWQKRMDELKGVVRELVGPRKEEERRTPNSLEYDLARYRAKCQVASMMELMDARETLQDRDHSAPFLEVIDEEMKMRMEMREATGRA